MDQYFLRRSGEDSELYSLFDRQREGACVLSDQPWPVAYQEYLRLNQENDLASSSSSSSMEREIQRLRTALSEIIAMGETWEQSSALDTLGYMQDCARAALLEEGQ